MFFIVIPAGADQVTPSDRVSNFVNVRQSADINSPSVGILRPNQTAALIESIPYWHHVRMVDGTAGYVSYTWTDHPDKADATAPKKDYLERYAFMWDADRVNLVSPSAPHAFVGSPQINNATYLSKHNF